MVNDFGLYRTCVELKGIAMRSKIDDEIDVFITLELDILVKFDFSRYNKKPFKLNIKNTVYMNTVFLQQIIL